MRMTGTHHRIVALVAILSLILISKPASAVSKKDSLGIAPQDENYYKSRVIKCKDGSKTFTKEKLNDEFCDCPDGTDEPGTSACPEGKFYCHNIGHVPLFVFSSRVNDGICDCCDGSDEYDGKVQCGNTCWEDGKLAREKLKKKIATYQEGVIIRKQELEKSKKALASDEAELSKLKDEEKILSGLVQKLKDHKERIEKAEEEERLKKEKEEERLREIERRAAEQAEQSGKLSVDETQGAHEKQPESQNEDATEGSDDSAVEGKNHHSTISEASQNHEVGHHVEDDHDDARNEDMPSNHVTQKQVVDDDDTVLHAEAGGDASSETSRLVSEQKEEDTVNAEGLSKEELGRLVASRWTGANSVEKTNVDDTPKEELDDFADPDATDSAEEEDYDGYHSDADVDGRKYDNDDIEDSNEDGEYGEDQFQPSNSYNPESEDYTASSSPSWLDKLQQTVQNILSAINLFKTPVDISEADRVRKEYSDSSSKLSKIQSRISSLTEKLKHDFGTEKAFYSFYDRCFEHKQNKYVYKVCAFKQASQVEGHSTTQLGRWEKFDESYRVMLFSNGDKCWNGPDRSLKVRLRCGLKNELTDVDEPSRCEYTALLSTPVLCLEEKLKELQDKLDLMNSGQPWSHDEL